MNKNTVRREMVQAGDGRRKGKGQTMRLFPTLSHWAFYLGRTCEKVKERDSQFSSHKSFCASE